MILTPEDYSNWLTKHLEAEQLHVSDLLYHYTNAGGLIGIIKSGKIWHTSMYHVNDPSEERFGQKIAFEILDEFAAKAAIFKSYAEEVRKKLSSARFRVFFEPFVACFSRDRNTLEQWRAYGDNGRGFAIGFKPTLFEAKKRPLRSDNTFVTEVAYGDAAIALIRGPIEKWFDSVPQFELGSGERSKWLTGITLTILWYSSRTKDDAYKAENEVRLMTRNGGQMPLSKNIDFRSRGSAIVPYFAADIGAKDPKNIHEVIAGPAADDSALDALYTLERIGRLRGVPISKSEIPYRAL